MRVKFHPAAIREAREARRWYAKRDPAVGAGFVAELDAVLARISTMPQTWPRFEAGTRRCLFKRFPYYVIYREKDDILEVVAVMHGSRLPGYWHQR